ncbi:helix-turn-helix domain-containing protein [uncultured Pseudomonas sp.]|uniref:helix-turn-helix domain-containing protein n=1 Tax=uncultured Pseudomonas sp. TaxID=114707 RepID=UPI0025EEA684|nr:helix-turn-helix transcriptional regulator [uncultured Pseudomonas sp.]
MEFAEKLKAMRGREGLTQTEFGGLVGISVNSVKKYEGGRFEMGYGALTKMLHHPRFTKYTLWLMTDCTAPDCGQISPL